MKELNNSEWIIMESLWKDYPCTMMEMYHRMEKSVGWSKSTVITLLNRMCEKGIIYTKQEGKAKIYFPGIDREEVALNETNNLLRRIYKGSISMMISTLVNNKALSQEEIQELKDLLRKNGD